VAVVPRILLNHVVVDPPECARFPMTDARVVELELGRRLSTGVAFGLPHGEVSVPIRIVERHQFAVVVDVGVNLDEWRVRLGQQGATEPVALYFGHVPDQPVQRQVRCCDRAGLTAGVIEAIALEEERGAMELEPPFEHWSLIQHKPRLGTSRIYEVSRRAFSHGWRVIRRSKFSGLKLDESDAITPITWRRVTSLWPPFEVRIRTPRLELRGLTDDLAAQLLPVIAGGTFDPEAPAPFDDPHAFYNDSPERELMWLRAMWSARASFSPEDWRFRLAVVVNDEPVGVQDVMATNFKTIRGVETYSWLGLGHQGQGVGREMRAAVLHFAFEGLGAARAHSDAFVDNVASCRVSTALGYEPNGTTWATRRGEPGELQRFVLTRDAWLLRRREDIEVSGFDGCIELLGL
jgi:RimJ/RimL family protein N-acetyltransferase